jgi:hypothetical protein
MKKVLYGDLSHRLKPRMLGASRFRSIDVTVNRITSNGEKLVRGHIIFPNVPSVLHSIKNIRNEDTNKVFAFYSRAGNGFSSNDIVRLGLPGLLCCSLGYPTNHSALSW